MKRIIKYSFVLFISIFIILLCGLFFNRCKNSYANTINIYENIEIISTTLKLPFNNPNCISIQILICNLKYPSYNVNFQLANSILLNNSRDFSNNSINMEVISNILKYPILYNTIYLYYSTVPKILQLDKLSV